MKEREEALKDQEVKLGAMLAELQMTKAKEVSDIIGSMITSSNGNIKARVTGLCAGNSPGTGEFPTQMASNAELWCCFFIWVWINGWVNNREAGDLRRYRAHYDVIVMS